MVFVLGFITLSPFYFCNHLDKEEKTSCFAFIVFRMFCYFNRLWLFLTVPLVGLQCVIVVFPDHTHLLSESVASLTSTFYYTPQAFTGRINPTPSPMFNTISCGKMSLKTVLKLDGI